jgi:spore coat polysaccharide biosynthesis protein SpsF
VIAKNHSIGDLLIKKCNAALQEAGMQAYIQVIPCNWFPVFSFLDKEGKPNAYFRTLAMQEMIKRGILFQGAFVPCYSHTEADIHYFADAFTETLAVYKKALEEGVDKYLIGEPAKPVFRKQL